MLRFRGPKRWKHHTLNSCQHFRWHTFLLVLQLASPLEYLRIPEQYRAQASSRSPMSWWSTSLWYACRISCRSLRNELARRRRRLPNVFSRLYEVWTTFSWSMSARSSCRWVWCRHTSWRLPAPLKAMRTTTLSTWSEATSERYQSAACTARSKRCRTVAGSRFCSVSTGTRTGRCCGRAIMLTARIVSS